MKRYYDQRRTLAPVFNPSDKVFLDAVTLYKTLGKLSDILHLNNRNNQLER